jgi:aspartate aminotransferase
MDILAQRIINLSESETLAMTRRSRELAATGIDVINLSIGEPDFNTPEHIKQAAIQAIHDNITHYPPVPGYPELRKAICEKLKRDNNLDFKPEQIVVSSGAKHSLVNAIIALVNPGDEVIVPAPYWVSYKEMIKLAQGVAVYIPTTEASDFKITPDQLEAAITPKSRILLYSSPCNPTGSVYTRDELKALAGVIERHPNIYVISDEIYELINFFSQHESIAQFESIRNRVVVINGVSKSFAMTGWRVGYLAAPEWIAKGCDKLQGQMTSSTSSISQYATIAAMKTDPKTSQDIHEMVVTFRERRDRTFELLKTVPGLVTNLPQGAFYFFPNVTHYFGTSFNGLVIKNACDLAMYLLDHGHIATVPGDAFGNPDCIRISYATSMEKLEEAISRLKTALARLQ